MKTITIGCIGMTHLGLIYATAFAAKGFNLIAYDPDEERIGDLQRLKLPVSEPQLLELITLHASSLHFTSDLQQLNACDLLFIACDVPTDANGNSHLTPLEALIKNSLRVLSAEACLVILSQVPPGFTRQIHWPKERLFYQVETLVFGQAVARALSPERYIVGSCGPHSELPTVYLTLLNTFACPILNMSYESAELAKIAINMFLVSSVSTTNTLAEICENIGADWQEIAPALRLDKRIGQHAYLTPGLGIAGGNLERDLNTILKLGQLHATETGVVSAWLKNSQYRREWVFRCIQEEVLNLVEKPVICILGLAYKPNTHSIKNSPTIALIEQLSTTLSSSRGEEEAVGGEENEDGGYELVIRTHDPVVVGLYPSSPIANQAVKVLQHNSLLAALQDAEALIIMTPWDIYQELTVDFLLSQMRGKTIIDPYRLLQVDAKHLARSACNYFTLGQSAYRAMKQPTTKDLCYV